MVQGMLRCLRKISWDQYMGEGHDDSSLMPTDSRDPTTRLHWNHPLQRSHMDLHQTSFCSMRPQVRCRSLGSKASRSESPKRLNPNTARLIARPGKIASHGAFSAYESALPESINPHDGVGSAVPSPRKLNEASTRMAFPNWAVSMIRYGAMTLGMIWRRITFRCELPRARAPSTYIFSLMLMALERTMRAVRGMMGMAMARITLGTERPRTVTIASARISNGKASITSMRRCR